MKPPGILSPLPGRMQDPHYEFIQVTATIPFPPPTMVPQGATNRPLEKSQWQRKILDPSHLALTPGLSSTIQVQVQTLSTLNAPSGRDVSVFYILI